MAERLSDDSPIRALRIVLAVAIVCALLVSLAAVELRPYYLANLEAERAAQLASVLSALSDVTGKIGPEDVEARAVDLSSGRYADTVDPLTYDQRRARNDPSASVTIPADQDLAGIKQRAKYAVVFIVRDPASGAPRVVILPVWGSGYQSALYGFLALSGDTDTVLALKFYEQGDTPGLGGRVQDPKWEALWRGRPIRDAGGTVRIGVTHGRGGSAGPDAAFLVDGISGATRTSLGVHRLIRFWLGDFGFGPYLSRVRRGEG